MGAYENALREEGTREDLLAEIARHVQEKATLQRELEAVRKERATLRGALDQIKGGSFPGASLLALGGNWKAFAEALQAIAASALSQPVQPVEDDIASNLERAFQRDYGD